MKILICFLFLIFTCHALSPINFYECELTKACFKTSRQCTAENCEFGISWRSVKVNNIDYMEFEMVSNLYSDNGYILFGFSSDKQLRNDGFVGCYADGNGIAKAAVGYANNEGLLNVINSDQALLISSDETNYLGAKFNPETRRLNCRFRRLSNPNHSVSQIKSLSGGSKYYIVGARGTQASEWSFEQPTAGSVIFSEVKIDFQQGAYNVVSGSSGNNSSLAKTHGIFMVIAWILCTSIANIVARYYKLTWESIVFVNQPVWLQIHRSLQITCVFLTTIAFILIFAHVGGYSAIESYPHKAHPILGIIVFILAIINPILALCRCKPKSDNRPWFNWIHFFVGAIAFSLSVPTIMIGMSLPAAGVHLSRLHFPQIIMILFCIFHFIIELTLEIHGCLYYRRNRDKRHTYEMEMEEYQAALIANQGPQVRPIHPQESGRRFKRILLVIHATVAILVTVILIITIAVN